MESRTAGRQAGSRAQRSPQRGARREAGRRWGLLLQGAAWALALGGAGLAHAQEDLPRKGGASRGVYVLLGGGLEGHTGALAPLLTPGLSYGATFGYRPGGPLGVEMGYSGSLADLRDGGLLPGADVVRNGAQAAVTVGLLPSKAQPYLLGGLGVERFEVRGGAERGLTSDTGGFVPAGAGFRFSVDRLLTADARVTYNVPLRQDFAPDAGRLGSGRYQVLLQVGGTY